MANGLLEKEAGKKESKERKKERKKERNATVAAEQRYLVLYVCVCIFL